MSERKVLNKYYPPDFDPSKIPRMKGTKNRQFTVRLMAPFNMRCKTCGEYIYKGKKFNAKKEDVEGQDYLGIRIFRFYIKCTRCLQEISFKTDPQNTDYEIEAGATRNFMALKLAEEQAEREEEERKEEEASNPMKLLENRTKQSKQELDLLESLEELKDLNKRQQNVDFDTLLSQYNTREAQEKLRKMQEEEDERLVQSIFGKKTVVKEELLDEDGEPLKKKKKKSKKSKNDSVEENTPSTSSEIQSTESLMMTKPAVLEVKPVDPLSIKSLGAIRKPLMSNLVKLKPKNPTEEKKEETSVTKNALSLLGSYSGSESDSN